MIRCILTFGLSFGPFRSILFSDNVQSDFVTEKIEKLMDNDSFLLLPDWFNEILEKQNIFF